MRWFRRAKAKQAKQETVRIGADHSWWVDADLNSSGRLALPPRPDSGPLPTMCIGRLALPAASGPDFLPVELPRAPFDEHPLASRSWGVEDNDVWTIDPLAAQAPGGVLVGRVGSDRHGWGPPRGLAELALDVEPAGWGLDDGGAAQPAADEAGDLDEASSIATPVIIDLRDPSPGSEVPVAHGVAVPGFDDWHLAGSLFGR